MFISVVMFQMLDLSLMKYLFFINVLSWS